MLAQFSTPDFQPKNQRDYQYIIMLEKQPLRSKFQNKGTLTSFYQNFISNNKLVYSECKNAPSDSEYINFLHKSAKTFALLIALSRMLREHDLPYIHLHNPIIMNGHLKWVNLSR